MEEVELVRRIGAPAPAVWALLSWRGMAALADAGFFRSVLFDNGLPSGRREKMRYWMQWRHV